MPVGEQRFEFDVVKATMKGLVLKTSKLSKYPVGQSFGRLSDTGADQLLFYGVPPEGFSPAPASGCKDCAHYEIDMYQMIRSSRMEADTGDRVSVPPPSELTAALQDLVRRCRLLSSHLLGCGGSHELYHVDIVAKLRGPASATDGEVVRAVQAVLPDVDERSKVRFRISITVQGVMDDDGKPIEVEWPRDAHLRRQPEAALGIRVNLDLLRGSCGSIVTFANEYMREVVRKRSIQAALLSATTRLGPATSDRVSRVGAAGAPRRVQN